MHTGERQGVLGVAVMGWAYLSSEPWLIDGWVGLLFLY